MIDKKNLNRGVRLLWDGIYLMGVTSARCAREMSSSFKLSREDIKEGVNHIRASRINSFDLVSSICSRDDIENYHLEPLDDGKCRVTITMK